MKIVIKKNFPANNLHEINMCEFRIVNIIGFEMLDYPKLISFDGKNLRGGIKILGFPFCVLVIQDSFNFQSNSKK